MAFGDMTGFSLPKPKHERRAINTYISCTHVFTLIHVYIHSLVSVTNMKYERGRYILSSFDVVLCNSGSSSLLPPGLKCPSCVALRWAASALPLCFALPLCSTKIGKDGLSLGFAKLSCSTLCAKVTGLVKEAFVKFVFAPSKISAIICGDAPAVASKY